MRPEPPRAIPVPFPPESRVGALYPATDLRDAYAIELPGGAARDPELLARFVFSHLPPWMLGLMRIRDALVGGFGLKTVNRLQSSGISDQQDRVGVFRIYSRGRTEIVFGEDDRHLDFRLSLICPEPPSPTGTRQAILATVVRCHNGWGRAYTFLIAPFHRLVARSSLSHAARIGWPKAVDA